METHARYVLIGLFTVIVVLAALMCGLWFATSSSDDGYKEYDIIFNEPVSGLSNGAIVRYNGIQVGNVDGLRLDSKDPRRVLARIRMGIQAPVKQDTKVRLAYQGITGVAYIQLSGGTPQSPELETSTEHVSTLVAEPSPLNALLANSEGLITKVSDVLVRAEQLLSDDNLTRVNHALSNLDQVLGAVAGEKDNISQMVQQMLQASRQANASLVQLDQLLSNVNHLSDHQLKTILDSAEASMTSLQRATTNIDELVNSNKGALNNGLHGLGDIGPVMQQMRRTLNELQRITRHLEENPADYLLGGQNPREFSP